MNSLGRVDQVVKVAMIFEPGSIALTGGAEVGMQKGESWCIVADPIVIHDPDTQEVLGEVTRYGELYEITGVKKRWAHARLTTWMHGSLPVEVGDVLIKRERYLEQED